MRLNQKNKSLILEYYDALESASAISVGKVLENFTSDDYKWLGMHPFNEMKGPDSVSEGFWKPLYKAFSPIQRRQDIFIAGTSEIDNDDWVISMGHLMGLWDKPWLGFSGTRKMTFLRYAEFNQIEAGKINKTVLFCDILGVLNQAGINPLPLQTGAEFITPGPITHDGILLDEQGKQESQQTLALINQMISDMRAADSFDCSPHLLAQTWHDHMLWFGPTGIGATYTIDRYHEQHAAPFSEGLTDTVIVGHNARLAEGFYGGFYGWPSMKLRPTGGFLGLPTSDKLADMRIVDMYRREGKKLAENWIFIDLPYWLKQQGLDIIERSQKIVANK
jgi:hypothetical protein